MKPPCKDCKERHAACHDTCKKYQEYIDHCHKQKEYNEALKYNKVYVTQVTPNRSDLRVFKSPKYRP